MRRTVYAALTAALAFTALSAPADAFVRGKPVHGLAMYGEPKFPADFKNFDYVNPTAPKGGTLRMSGFGTFDSFNPFSVKGTPAGLLQYMGAASYMYSIESLFVRGADEPGSSYCLLCQTVEVAPDNTWEEFTLRPEARFHDGTPVTADDVVFSFEQLMAKGAPLFQMYWGDVAKAEKTGPLKVKFHFKNPGNTELPTIMGELPVLSKAWWSKHDLANSTLDIPNFSGPYKIDKFEAGRYVVFKRDPNYWGRNLALTKGAFNFDEIRIDYYRDDDVAFEAFKAYQFDYHVENSSLRWATAYDKAVVDSGLMVKEDVRDGLPDRAQTFTMNLRKPMFQDRRVREALALAFDFDWGNKTLAFGVFAPMNSFWSGSELASSGLPQGEELAILEKYRGKIPDEVFTKPFSQPRTDGSGNNRENLVKAKNLLTAAGWTTKNGALVNARGEPFEFEFLLAQQGLEKWVNPYFQNLAKLGIKGKIRLVDTTQYINRLTNFDFDMIVGGIGQSISPGNEQRENWGSAAADKKGGRNLAGIKNPVVDAIIEDLIVAKTRESLIAHTRALDRVLLWNWYFVPEFSTPADWIAYWNKFGKPGKVPMQGPDLALWWYDAAKAAKVDAARGAKK
ncbi:MAG: extracellular solute-binding protein [Rhodospirillaceae bacterium]|nr:extracellular solute-binding protein [Rhodospirillaceae bacterium]